MRPRELAEIPAHWGGAPATVPAGDLNPRQGEPADWNPPRVPGECGEMARLLGADFSSAGDLEACNVPTLNDKCSDYILVGRGFLQSP
ncbi:MAG: hypothetical protein ABIJ48_11915 [Actinomycetota bacterium]